jgi:hypothetical protein
MAALPKFDLRCRVYETSDLETISLVLITSLEPLTDSVRGGYDYDEDDTSYFIWATGCCSTEQSLPVARAIRNWIAEYDALLYRTEINDEELYTGLLIEQATVTELAELADQIEALQASLNSGRGLETARSAISALRSGHTRFAVSSVVNNWDKVRSHPELARVIQASGLYDPDGLFEA